MQGLKDLHVIDFENNNSPQAISKKETNVYLWCVSDSDMSTKIGLNMRDLFIYLKSLNGGIFYSHNLKYDASFIIDYLLKNGYLYSDKLNENNSFNVLVDDRNTFYSLTIKLKTLKGSRLFKFRDSSKKISGSVKSIGEDLKLSNRKGEIDYSLDRPTGYIPTEEEIEYIKKDCLVIQEVINKFHENGFNKLTSASDSFNAYKKALCSEQTFKMLFPTLDIDIDNFVRLSYRGGVCYLKEEYKGIDLENVKAYDVNSMYPFVMATRPLPHGVPIYFKGKPKDIANYALFIVSVEVNLSLKPNKIPTIMKKGFRFSKLTYITNEKETQFLTLTCVDLKLMFENYEIYDIKYIEGYYFKYSTNLFKDYVNELYEQKKTQKGVMKLLTKTKLNSLYGYFAKSPIYYGRKPYLDNINQIVKYENKEKEEGKPVYTAIACFITAYAREYLFNMINSNFNNFVYCDTDSIHLIGDNKPINMFLSESELGGLKVEYDFIKVKYIAQKTYIGYLRGEKKLKVCCAGLPKNQKDKVFYDTFKIGLNVSGKLLPKMINGGYVLVDTCFTIKNR